LVDNGFDSPSVTDRDDQRIPHPVEVDMRRRRSHRRSGRYMGTLVVQTTIVANNGHRQHQ
jgi:hypothetical protein